MSARRIAPAGVWALATMFCAGTAAGQIERLPHADTTAGNFFGVAVAIDGPYALVGASGEHTCVDDGGAAYVFEQDARTLRWNKAGRLIPADCEVRRFFGRSVALSGSRALVASSSEEDMRRRPDVAYVFERDSAGVWLQTAMLSGGAAFEDLDTGTTVALEDDLAVLTTWGDTSHGRHGGAAYVFRFDTATRRWSDKARLTGSGGTRHGIFGGDAAVTANRLAIPSSRYLANKSGALYVFEDVAADDWREVQRIDGIDDFFIAVDVDADRILVGESRAGPGNSGIASIFSQDSLGLWQQAAILRPPTPYRHGAFGSEVALSGDRALVVGFDEQLKLDINIDRVVYVYARDALTHTWAYSGIVDIGHVAFGSALDIDGHLALIGAASENAPGAAYIVRIP